ncbi:hypothetical protein E1301_Tti019161 [Triplophysa tibetana]|uniref:AIG1-type G domain-containing protein n=1 Tax=Triplophysa tibetana TaxID=1572043 RepID=A0A5A9N504_9TELE|nr:hypothetical protein E1301_Tti019161 [Triplophysa tibetana]
MVSRGKELSKISELIKKSILIGDGNPARYRLQTTTDNLNQSEPYRKIIFGERDPEKDHKIILMVGETGTGKTTLINTMINYTCGVQRDDKIWIEVTDDQSKETSAHSQTSIITVYGVYIPESSLDLTIIDTPGYGDTGRGTGHDKEIGRSFLLLCKSDNLVQQINAVCLVIKADQTRLTDRQQYIFDAVQCLFGKDIEENIVILITHSNGFPPKKALTAVKEAKVKCAVDEKNFQPVYFLFDNCQSETLEEEYQTTQEQSWNLSFKGAAQLFKFLEKINSKTLNLTQEVLKHRKQLEANISHLQSRVQEIELKQNEMKQTQEALKKHKQDVEEKDNFEYTVEVPYNVKIDINRAASKKALCCTVCEENCHYPGCWWVTNLAWCEVMRKKHCTVCTNKCHYSKHVKEGKIYAIKTREEKMTYEDLKKKYENKMSDYESLVSKLKDELHELEKEKLKLLIEAYHSVESLEKIALNTGSLFILEHIDFLIEKLKEIKEPEKAEHLENIKTSAGGTVALA